MLGPGKQLLDSYSLINGLALGALRIVLKTSALTAMVIAVIPTQLSVLAFTRGPASLRLPALFHRLFCRVLGIRVEVRGKPVSGTQAVFISNHLSYLDVSVIGGVVQGCFVAKEDVRGWPIFGALSRLQQTVFITRNARRVAEAVATLRAALEAGHRLVLFPEGTTSDGSAVLPFKSSSFSVLADPSLRHVVLQPMTVELLEVDGRVVADGGNRDRYAYHGEMTLVPHLLAFMALSGARVRLAFHAPLEGRQELSRKQLAAAAQVQVSRGLASARAESSSAKDHLQTLAAPQGTGCAFEKISKSSTMVCKASADSRALSSIFRWLSSRAERRKSLIRPMTRSSGAAICVAIAAR